MQPPARCLAVEDEPSKTQKRRRYNRRSAHIDVMQVIFKSIERVYEGEDALALYVNRACKKRLSSIKAAEKPIQAFTKEHYSAKGKRIPLLVVMAMLHRRIDMSCRVPRISLREKTTLASDIYKYLPRIHSDIPTNRTTVVNFTFAVLSLLRDGLSHRGIQFFPKLECTRHILSDTAFGKLKAVKCKAIEKQIIKIYETIVRQKEISSTLQFTTTLDRCAADPQ